MNVNERGSRNSGDGFPTRHYRAIPCTRQIFPGHRHCGSAGRRFAGAAAGFLCTAIGSHRCLEHTASAGQPQSAAHLSPGSRYCRPCHTFGPATAAGGNFPIAESRPASRVALNAERAQPGDMWHGCDRDGELRPLFGSFCEEFEVLSHFC